MRAPNGLSGNRSEVEGESFANFVISAYLFLEFTSSQGKIRGVAAKNLDPEIEFPGELVGERRTASEDRAPRLDADRPGQGVAGKGGAGIRSQRVPGRECFLKNAIQVIVDESRPELKLSISCGRFNIQAGGECGPL